MSDFSMQIELWKQCNNFCEFCYLEDQTKFTPEEIKLENIKKAHQIITNHFEKDPEQIKAIGFLGGEFFQGQIDTPTVRKEFYSLCRRCFDLIETNKIRDFWCYCTLTIGDQSDLYELVDLFDKTVTDKENHHFWIQVSYDPKGRYNAPGKFENWDKHLLNLQKYPFIRFNVTTIMTEAFLQAVLSKELDLREFKNRYKNKFFFKQPNPTNDKEKLAVMQRMPWFFPKRKTYIDFLRFIKKYDLSLFDEILNITLRSNEMFNSLEDRGNELTPDRRNKETWEEDCTEINPKCGHVVNYQCYADSDACCLCDYFKVKTNEDL